MSVVSMRQLTDDLRSCASRLTNQVGLVPQATDRTLEATDLLFYLSGTSMPMAAFLRSHGLFMDDQGLHYDISQFDAIRVLAHKVICQREANNLSDIWAKFDLSTDEDVDNDGGYILTVLEALELMYGPKR